MQLKINFKKPMALIFAVSVLVFSCSKNNEEELRKKENEELNKYLNSTKLTFYKAIKVALRSSADPSKNPEMAKAASTILRLGGKGLAILVTPKDSAKSLSIIEMYTMVKEFYSAKDVLNKVDEDELPTILENIGKVFLSNDKFTIPVLENVTYDKNFEHVVLGMLWTASLKAPVELPLYELNRVDESKIQYASIKMLTQLLKTLSYSQNKFPWHALDKSDEYLKILESSKKEIIANPPFVLSKIANEGQPYYQLHMMGEALHGVSHLELEKEDDAMKDFEIVLEDAEKGGLDNELTWMIGAYVHIKKEDHDKALADLAKLEKSDFFSGPEKEAITETKAYIEKRENGKAFNGLRDKIAISKIMFRLTSNRLKELKQLQQLENTKEGKQLFEIQKEMDKNSEYLDKISNGIQTDSIADKAKNLVKGLFGK